MRNILVLASVVLLSGNTTNCNLSGPVDHPDGVFSHSVATMICGPADGPATGILLGQNAIPSPTELSYPYVRVNGRRAPEPIHPRRHLERGERAVRRERERVRYRDGGYGTDRSRGCEQPDRGQRR